MYYLRKIIRGKWPSEQMVEGPLSNVMADTVISELKTDKNKLSVWKVENDQDLVDAFIALGSNCVSIGTIDAVKISEDYISHLKTDEEKGDTPTVDINDNHRNIIELNYLSLGDVIKSILSSIKDNNYVRKTKGDMKIILRDAYLNNRLVVDQLDPNLREEILKEVNKQKEDSL